jgi:hypothetical protein
MIALIILYLISWSMLMITVMRKIPQPFYRWVKIITASLFVLIGLFNDHPMIMITLVLFFIGDILLAFANGGKVRHLLQWGLTLFWLGHIGLIFCLITQHGFNYLALLFGLIPVALLLIIKEGFSSINFRGLFVTLMMYGYTLGILSSLAIVHHELTPLLALGILIFIISDISLIFWYFYPQCPKIVKLFNVITYFGSVLLIALS